MEVLLTKGKSYLTDSNKINPNYLTLEGKRAYVAHLIKSRVIKYFNGTQPKVILDEALSRIDFSIFDVRLNKDEKLLLRDLIVYNLFLYDIDPYLIDFEEIFSRL